MRRRIDWFASPLKPSEKFMAAFTTTYKKYDINASDCLFMLIALEDGFDNKIYRRLCMIRSRSEEFALEIRRFFYELYDNEEDCIDILNGKITQKYFVKDIVIKNSKKKNTNYQINKNVKDALNTVFQNLQL